MTTLEETTARLAAVTRASLRGAELIEFKLLDASVDEKRYAVRWAQGVKHGTHVACLHADGREMLVWGHYAIDENDAVNDYRERT